MNFEELFDALNSSDLLSRKHLQLANVLPMFELNPVVGRKCRHFDLFRERFFQLEGVKVGRKVRSLSQLSTGDSNAHISQC